MSVGKILFILALIALGGLLAVGAPRTVLYESWENWNWDDNQGWNLVSWQALEAMGRDTVVTIRYHVWWPLNDDAFYLWNPSENRARKEFYNVLYFPDGYTDGTVQLPSPRTVPLLQEQIRAAYAVPAPCTIEIQASGFASDSVQFSGAIRAETDMLEPTLRLFVALITDSVRYEQPPGDNGQVFFPTPFRDFWPDTNGYVVSIDSGGVLDFQGAVHKDPSWAPEGLSLVAFVQDMSTHEVKQAAVVEVVPVINCTCQDEPNTWCATDTVAIPEDFQGIEVAINVPVRYHITDLNVCFDITHPSVSDLRIALASPDCTFVVLYQEGGSGANFRCTVFDDEADSPIGQGSAPYNESFQPVGLLGDFDGEIAEGDWTLFVIDEWVGNSGTLNWVCLNFTYDYIDAASEVPAVPVEYSLAAYPNPFNPSTTLRFGVEKAGRVTIDVFNVAGQKVETLVDEELARGYHTVEFNAQELPTGIYFAQIRAGDFVKTEKMVLLK